MWMARRPPNGPFLPACDQKATVGMRGALELPSLPELRVGPWKGSGELSGGFGAQSHDLVPALPMKNQGYASKAR